MGPLVELRGVTRSYGTGAGRVDAVRNVTLTIAAGEFTVLCGPSGSGKTTLLNQIGCLDAPTAGELLLEGRPTARMSAGELSRLRADKIGFVFQSFNLIPVLTAAENVELSLELAGRPQGARAAAEAMLAAVGLAGLGGRRPGELSGGQQQRVAVARALVKRPVLVIADEPTANLDTANGAGVLEVMRGLNAELGTTFLFSSHDPRVVAQARRVVTLADGVVTADDRRDGPGAP